ncbi:hypothetical protein GALMADRAFT_453811 [Galerina marginata CBS 339.88]|uniref:Uncharacterized protein n=1 Tax=Galerina marginata (strain CBS 339.88) TaxID=685588 RepID=A0A067T0K6_GALM3|nr:hypothetical protein GALMADRAFT_453811 [Galerina marginata CBS 339.88]
MQHRISKAEPVSLLTTVSLQSSFTFSLSSLFAFLRLPPPQMSSIKSINISSFGQPGCASNNTYPTEFHHHRLSASTSANNETPAPRASTLTDLPSATPPNSVASRHRASPRHCSRFAVRGGTPGIIRRRRCRAAYKGGC